MHKNNYSLEVLVKGRPAQEYYKDAKSFIESRRGSEYTLRFRNNSWKKVMAIFSVDGIEVLKGKASSEADNGYIVDAFSTIEVKGYRIDDQNVAAFKFSELTQGYNVVVGAEKVNKTTGEVTHDKSPKNSGVIGVRVIEEETKDHDYQGQYKAYPQTAYAGSVVFSGSIVLYHCSGSSIYVSGSGTSSSCLYNSSIISNSCVSASGFCNGTDSFSIGRQNINQMGQLSAVSRTLVADYSNSSSNTCWVTPDFDTSTQWGAKLEDKVKEVSFKRSCNTTDIEVYYASRQSLEAYGIDFSHTKQIFSWPAAFEDKKQYCKIPPGYKL